MCVSFLPDPKKIESDLEARINHENTGDKLVFDHSGNRCLITFRPRKPLIPFFHGDLVVYPFSGKSVITVRLSWVMVGLGLLLAFFSMFLMLILAAILGANGSLNSSRIKQAAGQLAHLIRTNYLRLGSIGNKPNWKQVSDRLSAGDETVRKALEELSSKAGHDERIEWLAAALGHEYSGVRKAAANILGVIGDERAVKPLIGMLDSVSGTQLGQTVAAMEALGLIGSKQAVPALAEGMKYKNPVFRKTAAVALEQIGKDAAGPLVSGLSNIDAHIRETAARALGTIRHTEAAGPLIKTLEDGNQNVREAAARSLGKIRDPSAIAPLAVAASDETNFANRAAAPALAEFGDARSIKPLMRVRRVARDKKERAIFQEADAALKKLARANSRFRNTRRAHLFCPTCLCRRTKKRASIIFCEKCFSAVSFVPGIEKIVGVIGGGLGGIEKNGGTMSVPLWNERERTARWADIDALRICAGNVENYDFAINAVILELGADTSISPKKLGKIPVILEGNPPLSKMAENMLRDNFKSDP